MTTENEVVTPKGTGASGSEGPGFESQRGHKKERGFYSNVKSSFLLFLCTGSLVVCSWPLPHAA
nr:MAG TPA: hypothetical protein [Caudoviricetes sp.]